MDKVNSYIERLNTKNLIEDILQSQDCLIAKMHNMRLFNIEELEGMHNEELESIAYTLDLYIRLQDKA